jgi:hypothetical protein
VQFKEVHVGTKLTRGRLPWLMLCVNLAGIKDAQIAGKILYLHICARVLLEEINI